MSEISSPKNILSEKYKFYIPPMYMGGNIVNLRNPPLFGSLYNGFSQMSKKAKADFGHVLLLGVSYLA